MNAEILAAIHAYGTASREQGRTLADTKCSPAEMDAADAAAAAAFTEVVRLLTSTEHQGAPQP